MTPRFQELIEQAIRECKPDDNPGKDRTLQRFAELIIEDLDRVLEDNFYGDPYEIPYFIRDVRKHFGVER